MIPPKSEGNAWKRGTELKKNKIKTFSIIITCIIKVVIKFLHLLLYALNSESQSITFKINKEQSNIIILT